MGDVDLRATILLLTSAVAVLAWLVYWREREHLPLTLYLSWMLLTDLVRTPIRRFVGATTSSDDGTVRLLVHVDEFIVLSWSFLFLGLCAHYFLRRGAYVAVIGLLASWAILLDYSTITGETQIVFYRAVAFGTLAASWAMILAVIRRRDFELRISHLVLLIYAGGDIVLNAVPYANGLLESWYLVHVTKLVILGAAIGAHILRLSNRLRPAQAQA